jgi:hypothetical protein
MLCWPGGDPPEPPASAPRPAVYFADTPALAEAFGAGSLAGHERLAVTRCGSRRQHDVGNTTKRDASLKAQRERAG